MSQENIDTVSLMFDFLKDVSNESYRKSHQPEKVSMLNDLWFIKYKKPPFNYEINAMCEKYYQRPFRFHFIYYIFFGIVCWPLALFTALIEFIRINKANYYNAKLYEAAYYDKAFVPPTDSRLELYIAAFIVWGCLYFLFNWMFPEFDSLFL